MIHSAYRSASARIWGPFSEFAWLGLRGRFIVTCVLVALIVAAVFLLVFD